MHDMTIWAIRTLIIFITLYRYFQILVTPWGSECTWVHQSLTLCDVDMTYEGQSAIQSGCMDPLKQTMLSNDSFCLSNELYGC